MRKVKYKKYDRTTRKWDDEFIHDGMFIQWGLESEEYENGASHWSVAIIENQDGTVTTALPCNIKFING
jgi:hypothetical protein